MHVRVNIPAWGPREISAGVAAILGFRSFRSRLREELRQSVPGWEPELLASGRAAIAVATRRLGLERRRVAVPAYVCPAVIVGLTAAAAEPVAVDCAPGSFEFDSAALERAVRAGAIDAILAANTYGADQPLAELGRSGIPVIEDAAYQAGCASNREPCGTRGVAGVWSFSFKALAGVGGGVLWTRGVTASDAAPETPEAPRFRRGEVWRFANYALRSVARHRLPRGLPGATPPWQEDRAPREPSVPYVEGAMSELQAALALVQWQRRADLRRVQREHVMRLGAVIAHSTALESLANDAAFVHLLPCLVPGEASLARRRGLGLRAALYSRGVQTERPYPPLGPPEATPNAHELAARLVLVPCHASLGGSTIERVAGGLKGALAEVDGAERRAL